MLTFVRTHPARLALSLLLLVGVIGASLSMMATSQASADSSAPASHAQGRIEPEFDPTLAALEIDGPAELTELQAAQSSLAAQMAPLSTGTEVTGDDAPKDLSVASDAALPAQETVEAVVAWNVALDELYVRVSERPEAPEMQEKWRRCLSAGGFEVKSPAELVDLDFELGEDDQARLADVSDDCHSEQAEAVSDAVADEFPRWSSDNASVIANYKAALGLK